MDGGNVMEAMALPFSFDSSGKVNHTTDVKKIWQDRVAMVIMTVIGERIMRPTFGSEVPTLVFENIDTATTLIRQAVSAAFSQWLGSLTFESIEFSSDPYDYYLVAQINYRYGQTKQIETVKLKTAILTRAGDKILEAE